LSQEAAKFPAQWPVTLYPVGRGHRG
jgi:hypothetical protein